MELNHATRTIRTTVMYYGPALCGKTTNLQVLHRMATAGRRGDMISVNTMQDRTLLFDLLPLRTRGFRGYELQIRLMAVPGQHMYAASRRVALRTADAVVFVANSAADRLAENVQSFREMKEYLHGRGPAATVPLLVQYNKRDLPAVASVEDLDKALELPSGMAITAVATEGQGLLESLGAVLVRMLNELVGRHPSLAKAGGESVQEWVSHMLQDVFGTSDGTALAGSPEHVKLLVGPTASAEAATTQPHGVPLEARLAERYVEAAWQLSSALETACAQREDAERRLHDLRHALAAAQALQAGRSLTATLEPLLARTIETADAVAGAFLVPDADEQLQMVAARGLCSDPLQKVSPRARAALAALGASTDPSFLDAGRHSAVRDLLAAAGPAAEAVLAIPFRSGRGLQGVAFLFYSADQPRPRPRTMMHLSHMAAGVTSALELARRMRARRARRSAVPATSSLRMAARHSAVA